MHEILKRISDDPPRLLQKIEHYCAYQERCVYDVAMKLHSWKVEPNAISDIIQQLQDDHFVDDERFARSFVRGKFHINKWGRIKIMNELRSRQIDEKVIIMALNEIGAEEYQNMLRLLIKNKYTTVKPGNNLIIREKIITFVTGKGFEYNLTEKILNELKIGHDRT